MKTKHFVKQNKKNGGLHKSSTLSMRLVLHCEKAIYRIMQCTFDRALYDMLAKNVEDTLPCYVLNLL